MVKCSGKKCKEKKHVEKASAGVPPPPKKGEAGPQAGPTKPEKKPLLPFPDYPVSADDVSTFDIDSVDSSVLLDESDDRQSCEKRMWLANVCSLVANSSSADDAFYESMENIGPKKDLKKIKKDNDKQYKKYQKKCNEISSKLAKSHKTYDDVKPCGDITVQKTLDEKAIAEKCIQVLSATNPAAAFPELNDTANSTFAQSQLADSYGQWLAKCRDIEDKLARTNDTFESYLNSTSSTGTDKGKGDKAPPSGPTEFSIDEKGKGKEKNGKNATEPPSKGHDRGKRSIDTASFDQTWVDPRAYRKEIRMMSDDERKRYFNAINRLKSDIVDGKSKYDLLVIYHSPEDSPGAHFGPAFLPFHREFLKQ